MTDRRFDRSGELAGRDEVLRLRYFRGMDGTERAVVGWKGPVSVTPEGLKARRELEYDVRSAGGDPAAFLEALGYAEVYVVERHVEYYHLGPATARLEWYPRMDVLLEVEADPSAIAAALAATGLPRERFSPQSLREFAAEYQARTGMPAALSLAELGADAPSWEGR